MPTLEFTVLVKRDGQPISGYPLVRKLTVTEVENKVFTQATGGGFTAMTVGPLASLTGLVIQPDQQLSVRLNGQAAGEWVLNANGLLLILDATINTAALASLQNASGSTANITALVGGP